MCAFVRDMTPLLALMFSSLSLATFQDPETDQALPKVGDRAPALQLDHVLNGPADGKPLELSGRVVVVEFSTSWCAGCRASAPHWNELAQELAGDPITLLSVTNESQETAERYAKAVSLATPFGIDLDGSLFEAFGVSGIPDAVVIGADGKILGFTHPGRLSAADLRRASKGEPVTFAGGLPRQARNWNHSNVFGSDGAIEPRTFIVRPCAKPSGMLRLDPKTGAIFAGGVPMKVLFARVLECAPGDLDLDPSLSTTQMYEMRARGDDGTLEGTCAFARERLAEDLGVTVTKQMTEGKALILRRAEGHAGPPAADETEKSGGVGHGQIKLGSTTGKKLVAALRNFTPCPVFDETGLTEPFGLDLTWDPRAGVSGMREALATVGLLLEEGTRESARYKIAPRA